MMDDDSKQKGLIQWILLRVTRLERDLRNIAEMARKAMENSMGGGGDPGGGGIRVDFRSAVVTTAITAPASATATHTLAAGWGFAQLRDYDPALNKYYNVGGPVKVIQPYPGIATLTVGKVIQVFFNGKVYEWNNGIC